MSRRGRWLVALAPVAGLVAVGLAVRFGAALAFSLSLAGAEPWLAPLRADVQRVDVVVESRGLAADLYRSPQPRHAILLVHGLSRAGRHQPDLARLARLLAVHGQLVLVPDVAGLTAFRLGGSEVEEIRAALDYLSTFGLPVSVAGFSFGAGPALLAAAEHRGIRLAASFGGYADLRHVITYITTGAHGFDGQRYAQPIEEYNRWKLLALLVGFVDDARDRVMLDAMARRKLENPAAEITPLHAELGVEGNAVLALVLNRREEEVGPLLGRLSPAARRALHGLSPLPTVSRLRGRLLIAHGAADPSIPFTESLRLAQAAGARPVILDTFHHTGPEPAWALLLPRARDAWKLVGLADALLTP